MATVIAADAFNMNTRFSYFLNVGTGVTSTGTQQSIAIPDGSTLVLNKSGGTVTSILVLDSDPATDITISGLSLSIAEINSTFVNSNMLDLSALIDHVLNGADGITGSGGDDTLSGVNGNDNIGGGAGNDFMLGGAGNDKLNGGGGEDDMSGGAGNDTYVVNDAGDQVTENIDEGTDTVKSKATYVLSLYLENLVLTGTEAVNGTGNDDDNSLTGNDAANILNGGGGNDTLAGKGGNDKYEIDSGADVVIETAGAGTDTVFSTAESYTLTANVERLTLMGTAAGGTGNELANIITGNTTVGSTLLGMAGNDIITGGDGDDIMRGGLGNDKLTGGAGNDELHGDAGIDNMIGGTGNDEYWVELATDVVTEDTDAGTDTLYANFSINLGNYANFENLILSGTGAINGTGTAVSNDITGNSAANVLKGGGSGDLMTGRGGDDNMNGGAGDDNMSGGGGNDTIKGGPGFDTMGGGSGDDTFVFNTPLVDDPNNSVIDFETGSDTLKLDQSIFASLPLGTLTDENLVVSNSMPIALEADDFLLYDTGTGNLFYDADGFGSGDPVQFANISGGPGLTADDIIVVG